jgi:putative flippase GtrA
VRAVRPTKYLLVGGAAWVADVAVFALSVNALGVVPAQCSARIVGAVLAFFGHKLFVFGEHDLRRLTLAAQALRYTALWIVSFALSTLALVALIAHAGIPPLPSKVFVEAGIVVLNYLVMRGLVFIPPTRHRDTP